MLSHLRTLSLFVDIARHRHVATAAEEHGLSQGAASQRIQQLEKELGVVLFDRSRRPHELTAAGEAFLTGCKDLLARADRLRHSVQAAADAIVGELTVAAIYSAGIEMLESVREDLLQRHPGCGITLRYRNPDEVERLVHSGECELGLVSYPQRLRNFQQHLVREEKLVVVCRSDHDLADATELAVADLDGQAMLMLDNSLPLRARD